MTQCSAQTAVTSTLQPDIIIMEYNKQFVNVGNNTTGFYFYFIWCSINTGDYTLIQALVSCNEDVGAGPLNGTSAGRVVAGSMHETSGCDIISDSRWDYL